MAYAGGPEDEPGNFGDQLSAAIVRGLLGVSVKQLGMDAADLVALGSILGWLEESGNPMRPHVWGSGFIDDGGPWQGAPVRLHAVRGELWRERMRGEAGKRDVALGDPAMLVDLVYPDLKACPKRFAVSVVPHYVDFDAPVVADLRARYPQVNIIDVVRRPREVVADIAASEVVLSSSLHGLIVAEAMGVQNHWTPVSNKVIGGAYKFTDYYSAFGVDPRPLQLTDAVEQAVARKLPTVGPLPRWDDRKQGLLAASPMRLFGR